MRKIIIVGICIFLMMLVGCEERSLIGEEDTFVCRFSYCNIKNETYYGLQIMRPTSPPTIYCVCIDKEGLERKYKYESPPQVQEYYKNKIK